MKGCSWHGHHLEDAWVDEARAIDPVKYPPREGIFVNPDIILHEGENPPLTRQMIDDLVNTERHRVNTLGSLIGERGLQWFIDSVNSPVDAEKIARAERTLDLIARRRRGEFTETHNPNKEQS